VPVPPEQHQVAGRALDRGQVDEAASDVDADRPVGRFGPPGRHGGLGGRRAGVEGETIDLTSAERPFEMPETGGWPGACAPGHQLMVVQTVSRIGGSRAASEAGSGGRILRIEKYAMGAPTATRIAATISENW
jgi:hypothetical protein